MRFMADATRFALTLPEAAPGPALPAPYVCSDADQVHTLLINPGHTLNAALDRPRCDRQPRGSKPRPDLDHKVAGRESLHRADPIDAGPQRLLQFSGGVPPIRQGTSHTSSLAKIVEASLTQPGKGPVQDRLGSTLVHQVHRRRRQSPETEGLPNP